MAALWCATLGRAIRSWRQHGVCCLTFWGAVHYWQAFSGTLVQHHMQALGKELFLGGVRDYKETLVDGWYKCTSWMSHVGTQPSLELICSLRDRNCVALQVRQVLCSPRAAVCSVP
jgi:hypothetical protein